MSAENVPSKPKHVNVKHPAIEPGMKFNAWTVLEFHGRDARGCLFWQC